MTTQLLPPIVTVEELGGRTDVVLCDVRWYLDRTPGRNKYNEGHIPGSIFVDLDEHLATLPRKSEGRHPLPAAASFAASLGSLGISHEDPVVAYDDSGGMSAGRLVWMLRVLGHDAALLDGGLQGWTGELETLPRVRGAVDPAPRRRDLAAQVLVHAPVRPQVARRVDVPAARADQISLRSTARAADQVAIKTGNKASATTRATFEAFSNPKIKIRAGYKAILGMGANKRTTASSSAALKRDNCAASPRTTPRITARLKPMASRYSVMEKFPQNSALAACSTSRTAIEVGAGSNCGSMNPARHTISQTTSTNKGEIHKRPQPIMV